MILKKISLINFRNYSKREFIFSPGLNLITSPNAKGKTNLLEAICLLSTGDSFRASRNEEMILWGKDLALVEANVNGSHLKVSLQKGEKRVQKGFWLDSVKKTRHQFLEHFATVIFRPEEIRIISGSPSRRREFLDRIFFSLDWQYYRALLSYEKAIKRRNKVLLEIKEGKAKEQELYFWDQVLAKNGDIVRQKRQEFIDFTNDFLASFRKGRFSHLSCRYLVSPVTIELLKENRRQDIEKGLTGIGPHRDDFAVLSDKFKTEDKNLAFWGSRGQQRLAILVLKLAQLTFIESKKNEKPVLLLDDLFSELDEDCCELASSVLDNYQVIITSVERPSFLSEAKAISL